MSLKLHNLRPAKGTTKNPKRIGRGPGSGTGVTAGKGTKGQQSRSGHHRQIGREGGQMPAIRRIPKRGFTNIFKKQWAVVNLRDLDALQAPEITPQLLAERGLVSKKRAAIQPEMNATRWVGAPSVGMTCSGRRVAMNPPGKFQIPRAGSISSVS